jgi:dihydroorotase
MILTNLKIFNEGILRNATILIKNGLINEILIDETNIDIQKRIKSILKDQNAKEKIIDCQGKIGIPGIIDIHSHLRDLDQSEKETFSTGTKAAAYSGITTVFNMPNTQPPANTASRVKKWMEKAKESLYVDVYFIAAVPNEINENEIKNILDLGVIGFKIYPHTPISGVNWMDPENFKKMLTISSNYQTHLFIHSEWPISKLEKEKVQEEYFSEGYRVLKYHNKLHPPKSELKFLKFALENYKEYIEEIKLKSDRYPSLHFCHISCIESYKTIQNFKKLYPKYSISFEVTPHHLLLSNSIILKNFNFGKVLPPLRSEESQKFLYEELQKGNIKMIGTDHAPHTLNEKDLPFHDSPSGFPGFETYPLTLLNKVCQYELSLENFIEVSSKNASFRFNLKNKGLIKKGYEANLLIIDKTSEYQIYSQNFKSKAKFSPFENLKTSLELWKVFLRGNQINLEKKKPTGRVELVSKL